MREWFISRIATSKYASREESLSTKLLEELNEIEADPNYTVQQVLYVDGQYQIFYTKDN